MELRIRELANSPRASLLFLGRQHFGLEHLEEPLRTQPME